MTEYRKISNGHWDFLQYKISYRFLWKTRYTWEYVWKPYYDRFWGRDLDVTKYNGHVNSLDTNLEKFVEKWPNIEDYFEWAKVEQKKLEDEVAKFRAEIEEKKGVIVEFKNTKDE